MTHRPQMAALTVAPSTPRPFWQALYAGMMVMLFFVVTTAAHAAPTPEGFADLADKLLPAVVNISTTQVSKAGDRGVEMPQFPPPFDELFRDMERQKGHGRKDKGNAPPQKSTALGSGFLIDAAGLVVTNNHVVADADEITVILHDERSFSAKLIGRDSKADLALLKLENVTTKLPFVSLGNSDEMRVGDWVIAIGNPFGLGGTVTAGIISARARNIQAGPYDDFLQTDAAINKGNSGGPLFNTKGEVIGINTAIFSPSGGSVGIGFSIPSNLAKPILADLQKFGKTRRGWLGVQIQSVSDDIAESLGLKDKHGALVAKVFNDSPASRAGFKAGDLITKFDGKDINEMRRLPRIVAETPIGRAVDVEALRDGKTLHLKLTVGELPDDPKEVAEAKAETKSSKAKEPASVAVKSVGLTLMALTPATRQQFELPDDITGVVIADAQSPAAEKGIEAGMMLLEVKHEAVNSPQEAVKKIEAAQKAGQKAVLLLIQDPSGTRYVAVPFAKKDDKE